jgi:hypothetical protein
MRSRDRTKRRASTEVVDSPEGSTRAMCLDQRRTWRAGAATWWSGWGGTGRCRDPHKEVSRLQQRRHWATAVIMCRGFEIARVPRCCVSLDEEVVTGIGAPWTSHQDVVVALSRGPLSPIRSSHRPIATARPPVSPDRQGQQDQFHNRPTHSARRRRSARDMQG